MDIFFNSIFAILQPFSKDGWQIVSLVSVIFLWKNWKIWKKDKIVISILLFLLYISISTILSPDKAYSFKFLCKYFVGFGFSFFLGYSLNSNIYKEKIINIFTFIFVFTVFLGFLSYFGIIPEEIYYFTLVKYDRLCVFDWATGFAARCEFMIMIFATLFLFGTKKENTYKYLIAFFVFVFALLLSGTRQSYIATFCSCLLLFSTYMYIKKTVNKQFFYLIILLLFSFGFIYFLNPNINNRISIITLKKDHSIVSRIQMYKMSIDLIKEKPIFGHTTAVAGKSLQKVLNENLKIDHFHNIYLNTLVDFGIVGFVLFVFIFYTIFCRLTKKYKQTKSPYVLMLFFAWIAVLISDCFDAVLINPFCSGMFFWITGLILSEQKFENNKTRKILFFNLNKKLGDAVVSTCLFKELKKVYPNHKLYVLISKATEDIYTNNANIDKVMSLTDNKKFRRLQLYLYLPYLILCKFDFVINVEHNIKKSLAKYIALINAKNTIISDKRWFSLIKCEPLKWDYDIGHISEVYKKLLKQLNANDISINYELNIPEKYLVKAKDFITLNNKGNKKILLINPQGSTDKKTLTDSYLNSLIEEIYAKFDYKIIVLSYKRTYDIKNNNVSVFSVNSILETASIVKLSDIILTVDTSVAHVADALNKTMLVLYDNGTSETCENNFVLWGPISSKVTKIISKYGCNVNDIDIKTILNSL